jgi:HB1/ASXL restriction endonuclease-like protein with HTH domain
MPDPRLPAFIENHGLFDDAYLAALAPALPLGPGVGPERYTFQQAGSALEEITKLWLLLRPAMSYNADPVRDLVRGVYKTFGAVAAGQRLLGRPDPTLVRPDFTVYHDSAAAARAAGTARTDTAGRYREAYTVIKVAQLDTPLDNGAPAAADTLRAVLAAGGPAWGILTDGARWRLYARDAPGTRHFAVNIEAILALPLHGGRSAAFLWFYAFFRPAALRAATGTSFLDTIPRAAAPAPALQPGTETAEAPAPPQALSFTDAAEQVLEHHAGGQPMHYRAITAQAIALGLLASHGRTPEATMYNQIAREISRQRAHAGGSRFVKYTGGLVGLTRWDT